MRIWVIIDKNGRKKFKVQGNLGSFAISLHKNIKALHKLDAGRYNISGWILKNFKSYVKKYGTDRQKAILKQASKGWQ